jgi:hypothetical protein
MAKLTEMAVSRVDGVDKPAIRKRWVLVKSEDAATEVEKDYAGAARSVIEAIAKEGVSFSDETVEVLRALVDLLELDVEFAAKSADDESGDGADDDEPNADDEPNGDDEDDDDEPVVKESYTADEAEALVEKALRAAGVKVDAIAKGDESIDNDATPLRVAKSKQPKAQGGDTAERKTVKKGEGMFSNIVLARPTEPYAGR